jgi:hypothetical protein
MYFEGAASVLGVFTTAMEEFATSFLGGIDWKNKRLVLPGPRRPLLTLVSCEYGLVSYSYRPTCES